MKVLGLSSGYHDASAALVIDGQPVAAAAEERFTLEKHDPSFPRRALRFCLAEAGLKADDLDLIAYHEEPEVKFSRALSCAFALFPFSAGTFSKTMHEAVTSGFWIKNQISSALDVHPSKIVCAPHHLSHAAHAFLSSPFDDAAVLTVDAVGEWTSTGLFHGRSGPGQASIEPVGLVPFPHSLGLVYSAFTAFLGFRVNDGECSTMALAAFGRPSFADLVRDVVRLKPDGSYDVDLSYFDFSNWKGVPVTDKFRARFGEPRPFKSPLPFDFLGEKPVEADADARRYADLAASIQLVLEESLLGLARKIRERTGSARLSLSGGVALNCVANGRLIDAGIFDDVFIPPDPGDGGGAMGAALYAELCATGKRARTGAIHPYFGQAFDESQAFEMLRHVKPEEWAKYARPGVAGRPIRGLALRTPESFDSVVSAAASALEQGKIVGWVQGRFENGPRALGNRSILLDPANVAAARRLSRRVKERAPFRPYACSIADFEAARVFEGPMPAPAKWMQISRKVRSEFVAPLRAALHVDSTTRPQVCSADDNPRFHRLLSEFGKRRGIAALLNTSFNEHGLPMASSPLQALLMFARTDMDMLVLNDSIVEKER